MYNVLKKCLVPFKNIQWFIEQKRKITEIFLVERPRYAKRPLSSGTHLAVFFVVLYDNITKIYIILKLNSSALKQSYLDVVQGCTAEAKAHLKQRV